MAEVGAGVSSTGVTLAGSGAIFGPKGYAIIAESTSDKIIKGGLMLFKGGLTISGVGVLISLAWPSDVEAGTVTGRFMTQKGFEDFLKLPKDQQIAYAKMDPQLSEFVIRVSAAIEQSEKLATVDKKKSTAPSTNSARPVGSGRGAR
jgi:hypothetical protein